MREGTEGRRGEVKWKGTELLEKNQRKRERKERKRERGNN